VSAEIEMIEMAIQEMKLRRTGKATVEVIPHTSEPRTRQQKATVEQRSQDITSTEVTPYTSKSQTGRQTETAKQPLQDPSVLLQPVCISSHNFSPLCLMFDRSDRRIPHHV
jgi:hypothetical protein